MDITLLIFTNVVTGLSCTLLGMWLSLIALNLEFVRKRIQTKELPMNYLDVPGGGDTAPAKKRRRKFGYRDVLLAVVILGFMATGINQISIGSQANATAKDNARVIRCLTMYSNSLADALDRRSSDNQKLADADSTRDDAVDDLLTKLLRDPPATEAEIRVALVKLQSTNVDKVQAKDSLDQGRKDKSYPQAPRDVCKA